MSVDILRVVEYKKNNKWFRLKFKFEQDDEDISTFGFGKNFHECWLENNKINEHVFKHGIPDDSPNKDKYIEYGCLFWYANLDDLKELREHTEHELHTSLKCSVPIDKKIDQILSLLKKEKIEDEDDEYYYEYPWNDYKINDKFDDLYAMSIWKLNELTRDIEYVNTLIDILDENDEFEEVRIIYIYNN